MKAGTCSLLFVSFALVSIGWSQAATSEASEEAIRLNNEGIAAQGNGHGYKSSGKTLLTDKDWELSINKLEAALKIDPSYQLARENLGIAHNNFGLILLQEGKRIDGLKQLRLAAYLDPQNHPTQENLNATIRKMGKNPKRFADRVSLGDQAASDNDLIGAAVEYTAAIGLKSEPTIHKKLGDIYRRLDEKDKAVAEYASAYRNP
jgi:tetratricopeptide (TPR) repeat protein